MRKILNHEEHEGHEDLNMDRSFAEASEDKSDRMIRIMEALRA